MLDTGGTAAPLGACPLLSKYPGGTANVGPLEGDAVQGPVCDVPGVLTLP